MSTAIETRNPTTDEPIQRYARHDDEACHARLDAAVERQRVWRQTSFADRARCLERAATLLDERAPRLARLATLEMGKLITEAEAEVRKCARVCRYYARQGAALLGGRALDDEAVHKSYLRYEPLGVVLAVMPWNFPFWQVFRAAAPALMAGNGVLLKHASNVTGCALAIEQLLLDASVPPGLFAALIVSGETASDLAVDRRIAAATLTGSEAAGAALGAAAGGALKPSVLELGGSDPFVVLDLERPEVIDQAVASRLLNAGQSCIAAKRFIVLEPCFEEFIAGFAARASAREPGDPLNPDTGLAPLASTDHRDRLAAQVRQAVDDGAGVVTGGHAPDRPGAYYAPTILVDVPRGSRAYREELFGPVACVYRASSRDEAVELANDTSFGLGASVWGSDLEAAIGVAESIDAGAVYVNRIVASDPRLPFGGIKRSGYGRELSAEGIRSFVNAKTVSIRMG